MVASRILARWTAYARCFRLKIFRIEGFDVLKIWVVTLRRWNNYPPTLSVRTQWPQQMDTFHQVFL